MVVSQLWPQLCDVLATPLLASCGGFRGVAGSLVLLTGTISTASAVITVITLILFLIFIIILIIFVKGVFLIVLIFLIHIPEALAEQLERFSVTVQECDHCACGEDDGNERCVPGQGRVVRVGQGVFEIRYGCHHGRHDGFHGVFQVLHHGHGERFGLFLHEICCWWWCWWLNGYGRCTPAPEPHDPITDPVVVRDFSFAVFCSCYVWCLIERNSKFNLVLYGISR